MQKINACGEVQTSCMPSQMVFTQGFLVHYIERSAELTGEVAGVAAADFEVALGVDGLGAEKKHVNRILKSGLKLR